MAPKGAAAKRFAQKTAAANQAVSGATGACGKEVVVKWMADHPEKVSELALFLMQGGFDTKKQKSCPGHMSRGTSTLTDLPKKWLSELLLRLCPELPGSMIMLIYQQSPALLMRIFMIGQNITADPEGKPRKVSDYYPRNYLGLEFAAHMRHEAFGFRLRRIAKYLQTFEAAVSTELMARKRMIADLDLNKCGVFSLIPPAVDGKQCWQLAHPGGLKAPPRGECKPQCPHYLAQTSSRGRYSIGFPPWSFPVWS